MVNTKNSMVPSSAPNEKAPANTGRAARIGLHVRRRGVGLGPPPRRYPKGRHAALFRGQGRIPIPWRPV